MSSTNHALKTAVHRPFAAVYADATARLAATGFPRGEDGAIIAFTPDDLYKEVLQLDNATRWILTDDSPITWVQTSGTGSVSVDNSTIEISGGNLRVKDAGITNAKLAGSISDGNLATSYIKADGTRAFTGDQSLGSHKLTNVTDPSNPQDAATKAYADALFAAASNHVDPKDSVRVSTTANITLSGTQTIDGVSVIAGDRVLVKNQSTGSQNGIYVCASGAWSRATDADTSAEVTAGMYVPVSEGTTNGNSMWILTTDDPITLGTTALTFAQIGSSGAISGLTTNTIPKATSSSTIGDSAISDVSNEIIITGRELKVRQIYSASSVSTLDYILDRSNGFRIGSDNNGFGFVDAYFNNIGRHSGFLTIVSTATGGFGTLVHPPRTYTQFTANQNDLDISDNFWLRWSSDASRDVTGMRAINDPFSGRQADGETHLITNVGSQNIVIKHESASSTATNRFLCSGAADLTLAPNDQADVMYDGTTQRWRINKRP